MGSINCKEYVTNPQALNGKGSLKQSAQNETAGSYHSKCESTMDDYTDPIVVCSLNDLKENEMKKFVVKENVNVLVVKQKGTVKAIGANCTHYGAPLNTGVLGNNRVRCPWHGACFNLDTGDIEDFPGLDSVPCFKVEISSNDEVKISGRSKDFDNAKRLKDMAKRCDTDERTYVIIGGGPSAGVCVETLRQEGFTGRIVMLCKEKALPYDRIKVSKAMDISLDSIQFRNMEFYNEYSIEAKIGVEATKVDTTNKIVHCSDGETIKFNKMYIATGCQAAKPPIKGADLKNVFTIRDISEGNYIHSLVNPEMNVVCLGASFIALEATSCLASKVKSVTIVGRESVPLQASFGNEIGERVLKLYKDNGVNMIMNSGIKEIIGCSEGTVTEVVINDDTKLPCDLLIMGTGTRFYTDFLKDSGIKINPNGSIDTDMHLMTNIPDIYVGGDIANAPVLSIANQRASICHYQLAEYHGRIAALNMAKRTTELRTVPFFFTMFFAKGFRYSGYGKPARTHIVGSLDDMQFIAYYLDDSDNVIATATCGRDPVASKFAELQSQGQRLHLSDIVDKEDPLEWTKKLEPQA